MKTTPCQLCDQAIDAGRMRVHLFFSHPAPMMGNVEQRQQALDLYTAAWNAATAGGN